MKEIPEINFAKKGLKVSNHTTLADFGPILSKKSVSIGDKDLWQSKLELLKKSFAQGQSDSKNIKSAIENLTKSLKRKG